MPERHTPVFRPMSRSGRTISLRPSSWSRARAARCNGSLAPTTPRRRARRPCRRRRRPASAALFVLRGTVSRRAAIRRLHRVGQRQPACRLRSGSEPRDTPPRRADCLRRASSSCCAASRRGRTGRSSSSATAADRSPRRRAARARASSRSRLPPPQPGRRSRSSGSGRDEDEQRHAARPVGQVVDEVEQSRRRPSGDPRRRGRADSTRRSPRRIASRRRTPRSGRLRLGVASPAQPRQRPQVTFDPPSLHLVGDHPIDRGAELCFGRLRVVALEHSCV